MQVFRLQTMGLFLTLLAMPSPGASGDVTYHGVTIRATVPEGVGIVFLTGNCPELGDWNPCTFAMDGHGQKRTAVLRLPHGVDLEYKFTLGSWDREAVGSSGTVMPNHHLHVDAAREVSHVIADFKKGIAAYIETWKESGVLGRLEYWTNVPSEHLDVPRHVGIWLPPGYDDDPAARYPVLYMHDGQNLFDPRLANTGVDWGVDEAIVRGVTAGRIAPAIVVGVWCTDRRGREYSPWDKGPDYARFLIEELMPRVNGQFRTRTGPTNTIVMGSSMGGLISFYLCWKYPDVFGRGGCLSTHFPYSAANLARFRGDAITWTSLSQQPLIEQEMAAGASFPAGLRMYFDHGTRGPDAEYEAVTAKVRAWLVEQGSKEGEDLVLRKFQDAEHNEASWRARLDEPLNFLLGP